MVYQSFYPYATLGQKKSHVDNCCLVNQVCQCAVKTVLFFSHLNGAVLETLSRPSLLITDAYTALNIQARRKERDIQLMSMIFVLYSQNFNILVSIHIVRKYLVE